MKRPIASIRKHKRWYSFLSVIVLAGSVGSYFLFVAKAYDNPNYFEYKDQGFNVGVDFQRYANNNGQTFDIRIPLTFHPVGAQPSTTRQILVMLTSDRSRVKYKGFTCGKVFTCKVNRWSGKRPPHTQPLDDVVCFDVPRNYRTENFFDKVPFLTAHYRALVDLPDIWPNYFSYVGGVASGTCKSNPTAKGVVWGFKIGHCDFTDTEGTFRHCNNGPDRTIGPGPAPGDGGDSNDKSGEGNEGTGLHNGGGSGSTANQQDDKPNPLPFQSPQGDKDKQPEIKPSPFFDGKQYEPGSDPDGELGIVAATSQSVAANWPLVLGGAAVLGAAGVGVFWWWKRR